MSTIVDVRRLKVNKIQRKVVPVRAMMTYAECR